MNKFFEVFNTLKVPEEIGVYLTDTEVTRVSKTSTNSLARVYLSSERLISKQVIYKAEDALKKQIFRMKNMDVRIIDRYRTFKTVHTRQKLWKYIMTAYCLNLRNIGLSNIIC